MIPQNRLQVIVFSKNRPWQLSETLRTFRKFISNEIKPIVIWKATNDDFKKAYEDLWAEDLCNPVEESGDFKQLVINNLNRTVPCVMFCTDDVLFYRTPEVSWSTIEEALDQNFGFSLRLAPNITFCQPANNINKVPPLYKSKDGYLIYNRLFGWGDWDYPFELGGTIYKLGDIDHIIKYIDFKNPNQLESEGAKLFMGIGNPNAHHNACLTKSCCSVLTINRVQDEFKNELAGPEQSLESLLKLYWENAECDDEWYAEQKFDRIHIGDFKLKENYKSPEPGG